jgi:hypothetical protein
MTSSPDPYPSLATLYIGYVRQWSASATTELTAILRTHGAYLAYWAAFTIVRLRPQVERLQQVPHRSDYADFFLRSSEVMLAVEHALSGLLQDVQKRM